MEQGILPLQSALRLPDPGVGRRVYFRLRATPIVIFQATNWFPQYAQNNLLGLCLCPKRGV